MLFYVFLKFFFFYSKYFTGICNFSMKIVFYKKNLSAKGVIQLLIPLQTTELSDNMKYIRKSIIF